MEISFRICAGSQLIYLLCSFSIDQTIRAFADIVSYQPRQLHTVEVCRNLFVELVNWWPTNRCMPHQGIQLHFVGSRTTTRWCGSSDVASIARCSKPSTLPTRRNVSSKYSRWENCCSALEMCTIFN